MALKICIPYRNRDVQLSIILPFYQYALSGMDYEIMVIEQDNDRKFNLAKLTNSAFDLFDFKDNDTFVFIGTEIMVENPNSLLCDRGEIKFMGIGARSLFYTNNAFVGISELGTHSYDLFSCDPKIYKMLGGLDQRYEGWGGEDIDFVKRATEAATDGRIKEQGMKFDYLTGLQLGDTPSMDACRNRGFEKNKLNNNIDHTYVVTLNNKIRDNLSHVKIDWINF